MEIFKDYKKRDILEALGIAAEHFLTRQKKIQETFKKEPSPFIDDPEAYMVEIVQKLDKIQKAVETYRLARLSFEKPLSKLGLVTFVCIKKTAFEGKKVIAEFSKKEDLIIGPLLDDPDFKESFEKSWKFLFEVGREKADGNLDKIRVGLEWTDYESTRSDFVTHYVSKVTSIFGYGR